MLAVHKLQGSLAVAGSHHGVGCQQCSQPLRLGFGQGYRGGGGIFFQVVAALCARYRDDVRILGQQPRQRQLGRANALFGG